MPMTTIFILLLFISFALAWWSMRDYHMPAEIKRLLSMKKIRGTIVFFKDRVEHY